MRAQIIYHGGKSCWIDKYRFKLDVPQQVTDPKVIKLCQVTSGFTVDVQEAEKIVRKVVKVSAAEEPEPKKKVAKKKTARRSYSDE